MVQNAGRPHRSVNKIEPARKLTPGEGKQLYPFVYLGIVKKVNDEDRMGRVWVYIREIDGMQDDPQHWHIMSYCSPFAGGTPTTEIKEDTSFSGTQASYGMWFPCPDVGNEVVCMFINGDPNRGIWMGGLFKQQMNHMVPGIPATATPDGFKPAAEYNKNRNITSNTVGPTRPVYEPLSQGLTFQGLDKDPVRGFASGGGQRQTISRTYGFLTPRGTQIVFDDGFKINQNVDANETQKEYDPTRAQRGDKNPSKEWKLNGNPDAESRRDELIRFRTRSGAQILISESEGLTYLINRDGTCWIEMTQTGKVDIYAGDSVSVHTYGSMNLTAQEDVNIEAGRNINMKARGATTEHPNRGTGNIYVQSAADTHLTTGADLRLLVGRNNEILVANDINVRSDNWDQNVNVTYDLCICEDQNIKVGGERREYVQKDVHTIFDANWHRFIGTDLNTTVNQNESTDILGNRCTNIIGNDDLTIAGERKLTSTGTIHNTSSDQILNMATTSFDVTAPQINLNGSVSMTGGGGAQINGTVSMDTIEVDVINANNIFIPGGYSDNNGYGRITEGSPGGTPPSTNPAGTPSAALSCSVVLPGEPDDPNNPVLAIQPFVNTLAVNTDYTSSISNRVPEHEPWQGHAVHKIASHAASSGPDANGSLDDLQAMASKPPAGSTAYAAQAPGGNIKGNTKPELATKDFTKIKATVADAVANPAKIVSTAAAGSMMAIDTSAATEVASQSTIDSVVDQIVADASSAATWISDGISTLYTDIESAVTPVIESVVTEVEDITNAASEAMASISSDVLTGIQGAGASALSSLQAFADDIIANGPPSLTEIADVKASTLATTVEGAASSTLSLASSVSSLTTSEKGLLLIANWEQYIPYQYPVGTNANNELTFAVGYGFQEITTGDVSWYAYSKTGLTEEEAWGLLKGNHVRDVERKINKKLRTPMAQNQFDAVIDLAYNRGVNNPAVTKLINAFNKGDMNEVANQFTNNAATASGDLLDRRIQNVKLFFEGDYGNLRDRKELKKAGLLDYTLTQWKGEHLWKLFNGFKHKEFPNTAQSRIAINQAWQAWERSTGKADLSLPLHLPNNSLTTQFGLERLEKIKADLADGSLTNLFKSLSA